MTITPIDETLLAEACGKLPAGSDTSPLLDCINAHAGALGFRLALTERDWYRLGGVVTADGERIADDLESWVEEEAAGDVIDFVARYGDAGYLATAFLGKTHYFIAPTGDGHMDFVQIEVEEIQEVVERHLLDPEQIPDTVEDIIDPLEEAEVYHKPLTEPRYVFRRVTYFADKVGELTSEYTGDHRFTRFLEEWEHSSAGNAIAFHDHWVVTVIPYLDTRGDHMHEVKLLSQDHSMVANIDTRHLVDDGGQRLADLVHGIDRDAEYPMAWYFLMLAYNYLPYKTVTALHDHVLGAGQYSYLRDRDMKVLEHWIEDPYHL